MDTLEPTNVEPSYNPDLSKLNSYPTTMDFVAPIEYKPVIDLIDKSNHKPTIMAIVWWVITHPSRDIQVVFIITKLWSAIMADSKPTANKYDIVTTILGIVGALVAVLVPIFQKGTVTIESVLIAVVTGLFGYFTNKV